MMLYRLFHVDLVYCAIVSRSYLYRERFYNRLAQGMFYEDSDSNNIVDFRLRKLCHLSILDSNIIRLQYKTWSETDFFM